MEALFVVLTMGAAFAGGYLVGLVRVGRPSKRIKKLPATCEMCGHDLYDHDSGGCGLCRDDGSREPCAWSGAFLPRAQRVGFDEGIANEARRLAAECPSPRSTVYVGHCLTTYCCVSDPEGDCFCPCAACCAARGNEALA